MILFKLQNYLQAHLKHCYHCICRHSQVILEPVQTLPSSEPLGIDLLLKAGHHGIESSLVPYYDMDIQQGGEGLGEVNWRRGGESGRRMGKREGRDGREGGKEGGKEKVGRSGREGGKEGGKEKVGRSGREGGKEGGKEKVGRSGREGGKERGVGMGGREGRDIVTTQTTRQTNKAQTLLRVFCVQI